MGRRTGHEDPMTGTQAARMTEWLPEEDPLWYWSPARVISLLVALGYLLVAYFTGNPKEVLGLAA